MSAPWRFSTSANATSPWIDACPTPVTRTGPRPSTPAARKYDAAEASPSTCSVPGLAYPGVAGTTKVSSSGVRTSTPKRCIRLVVIVT